MLILTAVGDVVFGVLAMYLDKLLKENADVLIFKYSSPLEMEVNDSLKTSLLWKDPNTSKQQ